LKARRDAADLVSDLLGDDHDLAILYETLVEDPPENVSSRTLEALTGLIGHRQEQLRWQARGVGERLYAEKPKRFAQRMTSYWQTWQREKDRELPIEHTPAPLKS
jgi:hypothetical protein